MHAMRDIPYRPEHGQRGLLDVWRPGTAEGAPVAIVMHGGGFQALSKERMDNVARFLVGEGYGVVNINYRLLPEHLFPAPIEDGLTACEWVIAGEHSALEGLDRGRLSLLGGSAGGYMAMAVGMMLGRERVRAIVNISGPVRRREGAPDSPLAVPPIQLVSADAPPLLCVHSRNDRLVPPEHSIQVVRELQDLGARAELYLYDGPGEQHGIWREETSSPRLLEQIEVVIARFLGEVP